METNTNILLISNSKILKNKFVQSLSNERNHFSTMTKTINLGEQNKNDSIISSSFSSHVCDYTTKTLDENLGPIYVQLIDANDKFLITDLVKKSIESQSNFDIKGIIYLSDELNSDTFAYVNSIHAELYKNYSSFVKNENFSCVLFNLINGTFINGVQSSRKSQGDLFKLTTLLDSFLDVFTNIQYIRIEDSENDESKFKLRAGFEELLSRFAPNEIVNQKTNEFNNKNNQIESFNDQERNAKKGTYKGEMSHNLRNGILMKRILYFLI
jgi:hypothetical protein